MKWITNIECWLAKVLDLQDVARRVISANFRICFSVARII